MIQSLYTGMHGMLAQQQNIDVIANNVANMGTNGYKRSRVDFREALYDRMISPTDNRPEVNLQRGTGVLAWGTARSFAQGAAQETGRALDFSIETDGFFAVEAADGTPLYTRDGAFYVSMEADGAYLVDAKGRYVLDSEGRHIALDETAENLVVSTDGQLSFRRADGNTEAIGVRLGVFSFPNRTGLSVEENGAYAETANSGPARLSDAPVVRQGSLEASNVDYAEESTRLIRAQRAYQAASRCVTIADQMAQICNSIRT
ncbi:MAG: flagellar hook-basal body protein [Oscillospiraceae bacterium]|jgi:flagellar basal-body rod protein FlgG|nr:flagellar hook-basal body protein [Oscillospiraceae bacterium]